MYVDCKEIGNSELSEVTVWFVIARRDLELKTGQEEDGVTTTYHQWSRGGTGAALGLSR